MEVGLMEGKEQGRPTHEECVSEKLNIESISL
jgi:hypothetical protein